MNNLFTAIMTKTVSSNLSSDVGGRIYLDEAPQEAEYPYIIFFVVSDVPNDTFTESLDDIAIQFSLFSESQGAGEITGIYNDLIALFDNCDLSITGYSHIWMVRQNLTTMVEDITTASGLSRVKHWAVDYSIMVEK